MSAITPFLDRTQRTEGEGTPAGQCPVPGGPLPTLGGLFGDFGVVREAPALEASHAELTRTVWIRRGLEEELLTGLRGGEREFWIESDCKTGELFFHLSPAMQKDILPWYVGVGDVDRFSFFGSNGKMKCPTWDLPAGSPHIGGSCPGATAGQTVVEPEKRTAVMGEGGRLPVVTPGMGEAQRVNERTALCQQCYALEGNYPSPHVQVGEILRYWWSRDMLSSGRAGEWVNTMVRAVGALNIPLTRQGIRPIRVHSAGDFFSPAYAAAWMEVANRVWELEQGRGRREPEIRFWAPTRAWAVRGFDWPGIASRLRYPNMIVRPSSYHVDDPAPGALAPRWPKGATSVINDHNRGMVPELEQRLASSEAGRIRIRETYEHNRGEGAGGDERFDWDCQTYAIKMKGGGDLAPSCEDATAPDGQRGCRACWTFPGLRINYTTH